MACFALAPPAVAQAPLPPMPDTEPRVHAAIEAAHADASRRPQDGEAWGRYGMLLEAHRFLEPARAAYEHAHRLAPRDFRWPYFVAVLLTYSDPERAVPWYDRALRLDSTYAPAYVRLGETLETLGRRAEALEQLERAAALDPRNPIAQLGTGRLLLERGDTARALAALERAYTLAPRQQAVVATLARAYQKAGRAEEARRLAQQALGLPRERPSPDPRHAAIRELAVDTESYLMRARRQTEQGRYDRALLEIAQVLELSPGHAEAHLLQAGVLDRMGDPAGAVDAARRALAADGGLTAARAVLAGALLKQGRFGAAAREALVVLAAEPDNFHMLVVLALVAAQGGEVAAVDRHADHAFRKRSGDAELRRVLEQLLSDLAGALADAGVRRRAAERLEQAQRLAIEAGAPPSKLDSYTRRLAALRPGG